MSNILHGGFRPYYPGKVKGPRRYELDSGNAAAVFPGDFVTLTTAGVVAASTAGDAALLLGAVAATSYVASTGGRVYGSYIPASTTYSPTSRGSANASYVWVWDDPDIEYVACLASHANTNTAAKIYAAVGSNMDLVATAGDTIYRRSGYTLDGNPIAGTAQFRILEVLRDPAQDLTSANARVVCGINEGFHAFFSGAGI
jgi:hypothetical protein